MTEITIRIERGELRRYTDEFLATAWHVAQANPAPIQDKEAGELAEDIGREIIRRWLRGTEPGMWHHQGRHYAQMNLTRFAKYDGTDWVAKTPGDAPDAVHLVDGYGLDSPVRCRRITGKRTHDRAKVTCPECAGDDDTKEGDR